MEFELIKCKDAPEYLNRRDVVFLDLRDEEAYRKGHLPGACHCPYERIQDWERRLPGRKFLIFYCEHGNLSLMAAKRISRQGYRVGALLGGFRCFLAQNKNLYQ